MRALILAAGLGSRLHPLSLCRPKALMPLANTPLIEYHLELLKTHAVQQLAINLHYLPQRIRRHLGDGSRFGVGLQYSWEPQLLGTAGGIKQMAGLLPRDTLVVLNSDILTNIDLSAALRFHRQHKALATLVLIQLEGRVGIDGQYRIRQITGRPEADPGGLEQMAFTGIHLIEPELLEHIPAGKTCCINGDIYPSLIEQGRAIYGYPMRSGFWHHVGTAESYLNTHHEFLDGKIPLKPKLPQIKPGVWQGCNVSISPQARLIPPVMLGANCRVEAYATLGPYAVLGDGCQLAEHSGVEHSVLWDRVRVERGAKLNQCVAADETVVKESQNLADQLIAP